MTSRGEHGACREPETSPQRPHDRRFFLRRSHRCKTAFVVSVLALSLVVASAGWRAKEAEAHQFEHPKILRLGVGANSLVLSMSLDVNPGEESRRLRGLFDRNTDGSLGEDEQSKLAAYLERSALRFTVVRIDGVPQPLVSNQVARNRLDRPSDATDSLGISILYAIPLPKGSTVSIEVSDQDQDRARHVPLVVDLASGWDVSFASQGEYHPGTLQLHRIWLKEGWSLLLRLRRRPST